MQLSVSQHIALTIIVRKIDDKESIIPCNHCVMEITSLTKIDSATLLGSVAICTVLSVAYRILNDKRNVPSSPHVPFKPSKKLAVKDELVMSMLDEVTDEGMRPCYVITEIGRASCRERVSSEV